MKNKKVELITIIVVLVISLGQVNAAMLANPTLPAGTGPHIVSVYSYMNASNVTEYWRFAGVSFDPTSTDVNGNYDRVIFANYTNDYNGVGYVDINTSVGARLGLTTMGAPSLTAVDAQGDIYASARGTSCLWKLADPFGTAVETQIVANGYMGSASSSDDDPLMMAMVPQGFGGGHSTSDVIVFDGGVDNDNNELVYVVDTATGGSTTLWQTGNTSSDNNVMGDASEFDGHAYFTEKSMSSEEFGGLTLHYIYRVNGDPNVPSEKIYLKMGTQATTAEEAFAVNPADGSVWIMLVNDDSTKSLIRIDIANAEPFNGGNWLASWNVELVLYDDTILSSMNLSYDGMAFSPDGKLLAVAGDASGGGPDPEDALIDRLVVFEIAPVCTLGPTDGDLDGDCEVNFNDFVILASNWLSCGYNFTIYCD